MAIARGLRLCGSQDDPSVSQPAPAVGRLKSARQEASFEHQQASDSGGAARLNRCGVYSHSPRLAPSGSQGPQGGASLCPGLSPYAPLGLGEDDPIARGCAPGLFFGGAARLNRYGVYSHSPRLAPSGSQVGSPVGEPTIASVWALVRLDGDLEQCADGCCRGHCQCTPECDSENGFSDRCSSERRR